MSNYILGESNVKPRVCLTNVIKSVFKGRDLVRNTARTHNSHTATSGSQLKEATIDKEQLLQRP